MIRLPGARHACALLALMGHAGVALPADSPVPAGPLRVVWEMEVPDSPAPMIASASGSLVVARLDGPITAVDAATGRIAWKRGLPGPLAASPIAVGNAVAVPLMDGLLLLLDAGTGVTVGTYRTRNSAPLLAETPWGLFIADRDGGMGQIGLADSSFSWNASLPAPASSAAVCDDAILAGLADGTLALVAPTDGAVRWIRPLGGPVSTPALCEGRRAWVGSADNRLYGIKIERRGFDRRWAFTTGGDIVGKPLKMDHLLLFFSFDTYVYALDEGNGHLSWKARLGLRPSDNAVVASDLLVVASRNAERLDLFRLPAGTQEPSYDLQAGRERFVTPPVAVNGIVAVAAARYGEESSRVIAFGLDRSARVGKRGMAGRPPLR